MSISERLQMVIKMNGLSNASFADKIGVQRSSVSHVLSGRNKPSIDFIEKILDTFPRVDANWLVAGKRIGKGGAVLDTIPPSMDEFEKDTSETIIKQPKESLTESTVKPVLKEKKVVKIIVYYDDNTFEETFPTNDQ